MLFLLYISFFFVSCGNSAEYFASAHKAKALSCAVSLSYTFSQTRRSSIAKYSFLYGEAKSDGKGASIIIPILFYVSEHTISYGKKRGEKERETMSEFFQIPFTCNSTSSRPEMKIFPLSPIVSLLISAFIQGFLLNLLHIFAKCPQ